MIKDLIMSGQPANIRIAAQLMKNITEAEFMVIVNEICDDIEKYYKDNGGYWHKTFFYFDNAGFDILLTSKNEWYFCIKLSTHIYFYREIIEYKGKKLTYKQLIKKLENI